MRSGIERARALLACGCLLLASASLAVEEEETGGPSDATAAGATSMTQTIQGEGGISVQTMCTNCNSADLSVGSFGNDFISMVCDGLPVPSGLAQIYLLSVMPPSAIDNVKVEKGAGRARLSGGRVGGEIDIRRRKPADGLRIDASVDAGEYGWRGTRADVSGRKGWFGGSLVASWAESNSVDADEDDNPDMASIDRTTVEGRVDLTPGDRHRLRLGTSVYDESQEDGRAAYDFISSGPFFLGRDVWNLENVEIDRQQYDGQYEYSFRDGSTLSAGLLFADRETRIDETRAVLAGTFEPAYAIDERHRHYKVGWFRPLGDRVVLRAGASRTQQEYAVVDRTFNNQQGLPEEFATEETLTEDGIWGEGEVEVPGGMNLFVGLRRADFSYSASDAETRDGWLALELPASERWLPRAALTWKPADPLTLRFSTGDGLRQPSGTYDEVCCGRRYRGNRGIRMERSRVYGLETIFQPTPRYRVDASMFYTDFEDLIVKLVTQSSQSVPNYQNVNVPGARYGSFSIGGNLSPATWIDMRLSVSWTRARNWTGGDEIPAVVDTGAAAPREISLDSAGIPYVPERAGSLSVRLRPRRFGLTVDLSAQYAGPQWIQQFDATVFDPDTGDTLSFTATPSFWMYNARVSKTVPGGLEVFVGADNLGDYLQEDLADPRTDYTWGPLRGRYIYGGVTYRFTR